MKENIVHGASVVCVFAIGLVLLHYGEMTEDLDSACLRCGTHCPVLLAYVGAMLIFGVSVLNFRDAGLLMVMCAEYQEVSIPPNRVHGVDLNDRTTDRPTKPTASMASANCFVCFVCSLCVSDQTARNTDE